jgi:TetR/AcrR family transcriptional regulator, fatty acid metabolism regulator protein
MNDDSFIAMPATTSRRLAAVKPPPIADKRDAILKAAVKVFAQNGFFQSQVADIARVAGVAAGTVYLYFRGKDDLLVSIFERTMKDAIDEGKAALAGVPDPADRLRHIARLHLERVGRDRDLAVVVQVELRQSIKFMESGAFRRDINANLAAKVFFGALDEMATNWMLSRRKYALAGDADAVVDLLVGGLGR